LSLGDSLLKEDVSVSRNGNDMVLSVSGTGEKITVSRWYENEKYQLAEVRFSDGSVMTRDDINGTPPVVKRTFPALNYR
jgi:hypothetical protein